MEIESGFLKVNQGVKDIEDEHHKEHNELIRQHSTHHSGKGIHLPIRKDDIDHWGRYHIDELSQQTLLHD